MRFIPSVERCESRKLLSAVVYNANSAVISDLFGKPVAVVATPVPGTLERVDLHGLYLPRVDLRGADLKGANMVGFGSPFGDFANADMENVSASRSWFNYSIMDGANLAGATMGTGSDGGNTSLMFASLRGADLNSADLDHASMYGADITGSTWQGTDLTSAWMGNVTGDLPPSVVTNEYGIVVSQSTTFPVANPIDVGF